MTVNVSRLAEMEEERVKNPPRKIEMTAGLFWGITAAVLLGNILAGSVAASVWLALR